MRISDSRNRSTRRAGFTLVEVLVAAGLCMLIMSVMATAFSAGIDTLSFLKSTGELAERLAMVHQVMSNDLKAEHLADEADSTLRVSHVRYDLLNNATATNNSALRFARPPSRGYFRIKAEAASTSEGNDPDGIPCTRCGGAASSGHILQMTVRLRGDRKERLFITNMSSTMNTSWANMHTQGSAGAFEASLTSRYLSTWAEVSYFLGPTSTGTTSGGQNLYALYRRVRVMPNAELTTAVNFSTTTTRFTMNDSSYQRDNPGICCSITGTKPVLGPIGITNPDNRLGGRTVTRSTGSTAASIVDVAPAHDLLDNTGKLYPTGEDLLVTNVLSFEVKAAWQNASGTGATGGEAPFADLPVAGNNGTLSGTRIYDTWTSQLSGWDSATAPTSGTDQRVPALIQLRAVQIKVRLYDPKNKITRQVTLIQDL